MRGYALMGATTSRDQSKICLEASEGKNCGNSRKLSDIVMLIKETGVRTLLVFKKKRVGM